MYSNSRHLRFVLIQTPNPNLYGWYLYNLYLSITYNHWKMEFPVIVSNTHCALKITIKQRYINLMNNFNTYSISQGNRLYLNNRNIVIKENQSRVARGARQGLHGAQRGGDYITEIWKSNLAPASSPIESNMSV